MFLHLVSMSFRSYLGAFISGILKYRGKSNLEMGGVVLIAPISETEEESAWESGWSPW